MLLTGLTTTARNVVGNDDSAMDEAQDSSDGHGMAVYDPTPIGPSDQQHGSYYVHSPTYKNIISVTNMQLQD